MIIFGLLFIPVLTVLFKAQPDQLYTRMFSQNFENTAIEVYDSELFMLEKIENMSPVIYVFNDQIVYADPNFIMLAPSELFGNEELSRSFGEVFSMIAVYNMYIPQFLIPIVMIAFAILLVLQLFFYLLSAVFLGISRLASTRFTFVERLKIVIMSSLFPGLLCTAVGFFLPAVHIILFQMLNLVLLFSLSKRYDKKEKELFSME
jgi:hypothetical protein